MDKQSGITWTEHTEWFEKVVQQAVSKHQVQIHLLETIERSRAYFGNIAGVQTRTSAVFELHLPLKWSQGNSHEVGSDHAVPRFKPAEVGAHRSFVELRTLPLFQYFTIILPDRGLYSSIKQTRRQHGSAEERIVSRSSSALISETSVGTSG